MPRLVVIDEGAVIGRAPTAISVPWWSFTKTVIAAAALVLVRDGRLALDARLRDEAFTLRQPLQHRAGLSDYGNLTAYDAAVARGDQPWSDTELMAAVDTARPPSPPDRRWRYSNIGYLLVRRLIEATTGASLAESLDRLVLKPLGVAGVRLAEVPTDLGSCGLKSLRGYHPGWVYHGLLVGSLTAAAMLLHRLAGRVLLPDGLRDQMFMPFALGGPMAGRPWQAPGYGLGTMSGETVFGPVAGHTGRGPGSMIAVYCGPLATGRRSASAFACGSDEGAVESAAMSAASAHRDRPCRS